ncbi:helix-turn-helix transcriptional regulator [Streptomyces sp. BE20]|uniref:helix-turn-helix transcriptional regulator n=1 Tax=Streptomyces sp. BE20 TaxID=3002525 RepID=UPI002E795545|nr:helix-turn-helix transcriptional regulator [Streptomyces sp. BE20]MEE1823398.1 helix-turn-helix transcriptional regulator [Streptomyces sp. BE20]
MPGASLDGTGGGSGRIVLGPGAWVCRVLDTAAGLWQRGTMPDTPFSAFLRARRQGLDPSDAGLPVGPRRRTPGLRREEVAVRAGISTDYYARLEQGRQRLPTGPVLDGIAAALLLTEPERDHLHRLAHRRSAPSTAAVNGPATVDATARSLLASLDRSPAFVTGPRFDLLAWNPCAAALMADPASRPALERNLLWQVFCCPHGAAQRANHAPTGSIGADLVAGLRAQHADRPDDRELTALVTRLSARSPQFAALWARHRAAPPRQGRLALRHPALDTGVLDYTALALPASGHHLFVYLPPAGRRTPDPFRRLNPAASR